MSDQSHTGFTLHLYSEKEYQYLKPGKGRTLCGLIPFRPYKNKAYAWASLGARDAAWLPRYYKCKECWELLPVILLSI